jgi:adenosylhomocysteine nucleosidase
LLAFLAAEAREFDGLIRRLENVRRLGWTARFARQGDLHGRPVILMANGPGPRLADAAARELGERRLELEALISTGFCGALDDRLALADVVVATSVNGEPALAPQSPRPHHSGPLVSADRVITSASEKRKLAASGAIAVEMEASAALARAREWNVPFYCVRAVTDRADQSFAIDFNRMRYADGRFSRTAIIGAALRRPFACVPELMRLNKTCARAAEALGDFLADCRF